VSKIDPITERMLERLDDPSSTPAEFQSLIGQGAQVYRRYKVDYEDRTPVITAAIHPDSEVLRVFLEVGAHSKLNDDGRFTLFLRAATNAHIQLLFQYNVEYPKPTKYGETPLSSIFYNPDLERIRCYMEQGVPIDELRCTPIHLAILFDPLSVKEAILQHPTQLEHKDRWSRTPLLLACLMGELDAVQALVAAGSNLRAVDHVASGATHFAAKSETPTVMKFLIEQGLTGLELDEFGHTPLKDAVEFDRDAVVDYLVEQIDSVEQRLIALDDALYYAASPKMAFKLMNLGANPMRLDSEMRAQMNPSTAYPFSLDQVALEQFQAARKPRFGVSNPQEWNEPFWQAMIVSRDTAYGAIIHFDVERNYGAPRENPVWCASRFGQSMTFLPDGRVIEIAGEHEDGYDPDFCIYNDVFVHEPGQAPRVFLYPSHVFPPTDFHTATLVGDWIYIIGSLGYQEDRNLNKCPVYRLNVQTMSIEYVETSGTDPGRVCRHRARLVNDGQILIRDGQLCANSIKYGTPHEVMIFDTHTHVWLRPT
jgi:ankyrin repeat protein